MSKLLGARTIWAGERGSSTALDNRRTMLNFAHAGTIGTTNVSRRWARYNASTKSKIVAAGTIGTTCLWKSARNGGTAIGNTAAASAVLAHNQTDWAGDGGRTIRAGSPTRAVGTFDHIWGHTFKIVWALSGIVFA